MAMPRSRSPLGDVDCLCEQPRPRRSRGVKIELLVSTRNRRPDALSAGMNSWAPGIGTFPRGPGRRPCRSARSPPTRGHGDIIAGTPAAARAPRRHPGAPARRGFVGRPTKSDAGRRSFCRPASESVVPALPIRVCRSGLPIRSADQVRPHPPSPTRATRRRRWRGAVAGHPATEGADDRPGLGDPVQRLAPVLPTGRSARPADFDDGSAGGPAVLAVEDRRTAPDPRRTTRRRAGQVTCSTGPGCR